jgi:hypothetical protein
MIVDFFVYLRLYIKNLFKYLTFFDHTFQRHNQIVLYQKNTSHAT